MRALILLMLLAATPAFAAARGCAPYATAIGLDFQTLRPDVRTNMSLNTTGIRDLVRGKSQQGLDSHSEPLGVTLTTPSFAIDGRTRIETHGGVTCVYLESLRAEFGYRNMEVYLANEYPPGSCEYRAILDHENQHVSLSRAALADHAGRVRLALEDVLGSLRPLQTRDLRGATRALLNGVTQRMGPALAAFHKDIDVRNAVIDSPSNYKAIGTICKDWDRGNKWPQKPQ